MRSIYLKSNTSLRVFLSLDLGYTPPPPPKKIDLYAAREVVTVLYWPDMRQEPNCLKGMKKTADSRSQCPDLNLGPSEYDGGIQPSPRTQSSATHIPRQHGRLCTTSASYFEVLGFSAERSTILSNIFRGFIQYRHVTARSGSQNYVTSVSLHTFQTRYSLAILPIEAI
jgi:hypothetical protein